MGNMSYCRFENTSSDLEDCVQEIEVNGIEELSDTERQYAQEMYEQCSRYIEAYDGLI